MPTMALGMRRGPRVAITDKALIVAAVGGKLGGGKDGDVMAWRSEDNGHTWSGPKRVNSVEGSAREGLHAIAARPDGTVFAAWLDLRDGAMRVYGARSKDSGATWEANRPGLQISGSGDLPLLSSIGGVRTRWDVVRDAPQRPGGGPGYVPAEFEGRGRDVLEGGETREPRHGFWIGARWTVGRSPLGRIRSRGPSGRGPIRFTWPSPASRSRNSGRGLSRGRLRAPTAWRPCGCKGGLGG